MWPDISMGWNLKAPKNCGVDEEAKPDSEIRQKCLAWRSYLPSHTASLRLVLLYYQGNYCEHEHSRRFYCRSLATIRRREKRIVAMSTRSSAY